jgi:hypothetical protein
MSVAFISVTCGSKMPCKGLGWSITIGAIHSPTIEATCANCYKAGVSCGYGVR